MPAQDPSPSAAELRANLGHPVIDADGHTVEFLPALLPYFQKAGVADPGPPAPPEQRTGVGK